jgi:hypothetical protein
MRIGGRRKGATQFLAAVFLLAQTAMAVADRAVVCGVQKYPNLDPSASNLEGCLNDAMSMADVLQRRYQFQVKLLVNEQATKQGILNAIAEVAANIRPDERFVFFFAGHGRQFPETGFMPYDALEVNPSNPKELNSMRPEDLSAALRSMNARSKTVILDACHSGAMSRAGTGTLKARYYAPPAYRGSRHLELKKKTVTGADAQSQYDTSKGTVCYVTACLDHEQAFEDRFPDGKNHGIFSYNLVSRLDGETPSWEMVIAEVKQKVTKRTSEAGLQQNPTLSPAYQRAPIFEAKDVPSNSTRAIRTLSDLFSTQRPDPERLSVKVTPDQPSFQIGEYLKLEISVNRPGNLVILGQHKDRLYLFYPSRQSASDSLTAEMCAVKPGVLHLPDDPLSRTSFNRVGQDQVKAFLFDSAEQAQAVLDVFNTANEAKFDDLIGKLLELKSNSEGYVTSGFSYDVGDALIGGGPLRDATALFRRLSGDESVAKHVREQIYSSDWDSLIGIVGRSRDLDQRAKDKLIEILNKTLQEVYLYDPQVFEKLPKSDRIKELLAKAPPIGSEECTELNRLILEAAFPAEVGVHAQASGARQ